MNTTAEHTGRFDVRITSDSHFGWIRTRMALERTLMAWIRTGLALIGFGFTIVQFFQRLNEMQGVAPALRPQAPRNMGLALIAAGVMALFISGWQYRRLVHYLWSNEFKPLAGLDAKDMHPVYSQSPLLAVLIAVIAIGLFAFFAVLLRIV
ncbi:MAG: YidH family protein [Steroidobacteraceae bacterium]